MIINLTGDGKGKTTSAFGTSLRAIKNYNILIIQFMKKESSEAKVLSKFENVNTMCFGLDEFYFPDKNRKEYKEVIKKGWNKFKEEKENYNFIVLDEINVVTDYGLIHPEEIVDQIKFFKKSKEKHIIITGRNSPKILKDISDTISEINEIKHHYQFTETQIKGIDK